MVAGLPQGPGLPRLTLIDAHTARIPVQQEIFPVGWFPSTNRPEKLLPCAGDADEFNATTNDPDQPQQNVTQPHFLDSEDSDAEPA